MGRTLVESAYLVGQAQPINHKAFRLLGHMAVTALDTASDGRRPRLYWRGRQAQAFALGYTPLDCDSPGARSNVSKAVAELLEARLIQKLDGGFSGRAATYELLLHGDFASPDLLPGIRDGVPSGALPDLVESLSTGALVGGRR